MPDTLPTSLGETLVEVMREQGLTQVELGRRAGLSTKHIWCLRQNRVRLTVSTAQKLEIGTGVPSITWLRLDTNYRDAVARRQRMTKQRTSSIMDEIERAS